jgi:hypothetical protein
MGTLQRGLLRELERSSHMVSRRTKPLAQLTQNSANSSQLSKSGLSTQISTSFDSLHIGSLCLKSEDKCNRDFSSTVENEGGKMLTVLLLLIVLISPLKQTPYVFWKSNGHQPRDNEDYRQDI